MKRQEDETVGANPHPEHTLPFEEEALTPLGLPVSGEICRCLLNLHLPKGSSVVELDGGSSVRLCTTMSGSTKLTCLGGQSVTIGHSGDPPAYFVFCK